MAARTLLAVAGLGGCDPTPARVAPAPGQPLAELSTGERGRFLLGRALFERVATPDEGLGPLYNAVRCSDCHDRPAVGGSGAQRFRVRKATRFAAGRCDLLRHEGGDNVQDRTTDVARARGVGSEVVPPSATATTRMTAPSLLGIGLVDAVAEADLERLADPDDADGDGVSGRLPRLPDGRSARFGRKGDAATLADFVDAALRTELGFTTPAHPIEETPNGSPLPPGADPAPEPEISEAALGQLTDYVRFLAPAAAQRPEDSSGEASARFEADRDAIARGRALFLQIGCASCHVEELRTATSPVAALSNRTFRPYSDYLLHDLGPGLADVCGVDAAPGELRTAPLWGLRHRTRFLHDGRAQTVEDAIRAHGGEARRALEAHSSLDADARGALARFLASL